MKFGALLRASAQEMPELQSLFNCYKQLKKRLKRLPEKGLPSPNGEKALPIQPGCGAVLAHERAFVALLISDIQAFNETFVEREEQSVIRLSLLEEKATQAKRPEEVAALYKDFVNFHGQTLMLVHWSILAYTSVLKILKKHYKRTGLQIQEFNMQQLLSQPFCSVELTSGLVRKAESKAQELANCLDLVPRQGSRSHASNRASPVEELMTAARQSVQCIQSSAALGSDALDRHLSSQPSSSEEGSMERNNDTEVVSSRVQGKTARKSQKPAGKLTGNKHERDANEAELDPSPKQQRLAPQANGHTHQSDNPDIPKDDSDKDLANDKPKGSLKLHRAHSMAADNGAQLCQDAKGSNGTALPDTPRERSTSVSSGNKSLSYSPSLTMGQGWTGGDSHNILKQTKMALGLWEQLHETASTPSTVVPPLQSTKHTRQAANSAA